MSDACVLLEAFKQLIDPTGADESDDGESDLVAMSKKTTGKAKRFLAQRAAKEESLTSPVREKRVSKKVESPVSPVREKRVSKKVELAASPVKEKRLSKKLESPTTPVKERKPSKKLELVTKLNPQPTIATDNESKPQATSLFFYAERATFNNDRLRVETNQLRTILQGGTYFSLNLNDAIEQLKHAFNRTEGFRVVITVDDNMQLREAVDVKYLVSQTSGKQVVEFVLGDNDLDETAELPNELTAVNLFFGNL